MQNKLEQWRTMANKFEKNKNCEYCGKDLKAKYRSKRFCNDKCRIYFNRENVVAVVAENNKEENKSAIEAERETVSEVSKKAEYPLTEKEVTRHKLWEKGDPREGSNGFFLKYGAFKYDEITKK